MLSQDTYPVLFLISSLRMAGITGQTVIHIPDHIFVFFIHLGLIVLMAVKARKLFIITRNMAIAAKGAGMSSRTYRELMIENSLGP
jgi:hypothetical protein